MFSVQRALLDLPAATLAFYGAALGAGAVPAFAAAILTKDTFALALCGLPGFPRGEKHRAMRFAARVLLALAPAICWWLYVHSVFGWTKEPPDNFAWPFAGYVSALVKGFAEFHSHQNIFSATELLAPVSLLVQLVWLLVVARRWDCRHWRIGAAFGVASALMSHAPFVEQMSYCRDTIPMTLAFNIGLMRCKTRAFLPWFIAGNIGLTWGAISLATR
jgi:hypothetical protein